MYPPPASHARDGAGDARHEGHAALPARRDLPGEGLRDAVGGNDVGAPDLLPGVVVDRAEVLLPAEDPGVVDEDVERLGCERRGQSGDIRRVRHFEPVQLSIPAREAAFELAGFFGAAATRVYPPPVGGVGARELEADPAV